MVKEKKTQRENKWNETLKMKWRISVCNYFKKALSKEKQKGRFSYKELDI